MVKEDTSTVEGKLHQIAEQLEGWTYHPPDEHFAYAGDFHGPDGLKLCIWYKDRHYLKMEATGAMYPFQKVNFDSVKIGFSLRRPAKPLAADINRRLIEPYKRAWKEASERLAVYQAEEQGKEEVVKSLLKILGPEAHRWKHKSYAGCLADDGESLSLAFQVGSSVDFKLSVSPRLAKKLCRLLAKEAGKGVS